MLAGRYMHTTHTHSFPHRLTFVLECAGARKCFVNAWNIKGGEPHRTKVYLQNAGGASIKEDVRYTVLV